MYVGVEIALVRPYLWPAGAGARVSIDPASRLPLIARPPDVRRQMGRSPVVTDVAPGSPAAAAGVKPGELVTRIAPPEGPPAELSGASARDLAGHLESWRRLYWTGVRGPVEWSLSDTAGTRRVALARPSMLHAVPKGWSRLHLGMMLQAVVFTGAAVVLLLLRSENATAGLCALALALSGVAAGGPLLGAESALPVGRALTVLAWIASPLAFPVIALAILYFPSRSTLVARHRWIVAVPFLIAAPMILPSIATSLYLAGVDGLADAALWDATHPGVYFSSFAAALLANIAVIGEGIHRFKSNRDANERRRIRMAVYTAVPGVIAYALKDGVPIVAMLGDGSVPAYPVPVLVVLQLLVLLPAFGLVYAVGVARVLGPRTVLRRSLQYAFASRTLTALAILPGVALTLSLVRDRQRTVGELVMSSSGLYIVLIALSIAAIKYRERARQWLDQRFFRAEYDARKVLLSLASRVRFETDPADLATMVVDQIDEALHPDMVAILVSGIDEGRLTPTTVLHGSAESLPADGGLGGMLRWSDTPLDIVRQDPRSPVHRLPADEQDWLHCTGASLLVPVLGQDKALVAVIVLGERRSEEAYTDEDRELLASIASQMGLGFDVARLRRRAEARADLEQETTRMVALVPAPLSECPKCGRCEEPDVRNCPVDGSPMVSAHGVPRTVDNKYRIEQLLGRGGMGAVYRARDMRLDRLVALKVVRAELLSDPEARLRFRREAQIVARLQHPSIVAVYDYGTFADGGAYLVMELVKGEDLRHVLQREGQLEAAHALKILRAVCSAIEAAHREGVLHRDLKPENILLPPGGDAKVLDFGVAKVIDTPQQGASETVTAPPTLMTAPGLIIGTPAYMAPEQFQMAPRRRPHGRLQPRSDCV